MLAGMIMTTLLWNFIFLSDGLSGYKVSLPRPGTKLPGPATNSNIICLSTSCKTLRETTNWRTREGLLFGALYCTSIDTPVLDVGFYMLLQGPEAASFLGGN